MAMADNMSVPQAHVLLLPFPAQGHINPFMQFAQFLIHNNIMVTFANTEENHQKLNHLHSTQRLVRFVSFPDGLPPQHGRLHEFPELVQALMKNAPSHIHKIVQDSMASEDAKVPSISAIIADGSYTFIQGIADCFRIPLISVVTCSICSYIAYSSFQFLKQQGILPLPEEENAVEELMNKLVGFHIPTMENVRVKDLPSFLLDKKDYDFWIEWLETATGIKKRADLIIINSWEDLDGPLIAWLNEEYHGKVLSIGPLILLSEKMNTERINTSLWKEGDSCITWLDRQNPKSVIYVGFGSITLLSHEQVAELALGLENSGYPFLWVVRPDLINNEAHSNNDGVTSNSCSVFSFKDFMERCKNKAFFVEWAPQWKVLLHESVGVFVTHSGWNSITESLCAGVPMICWPYFADQLTNARFVSSVWNVGVQLREKMETVEIECAIKKIMEGYGGFDKEGQCIIENVKKLCDGAIASINEDGSSIANLELLLQYLLTSKASKRVFN